MPFVWDEHHFEVQDSQRVFWNAFPDAADIFKRNHQPFGPKIPRKTPRRLWFPNRLLGTSVAVNRHLDPFSSCVFPVDGAAATITRSLEERAARPRSRGRPPFRSRKFGCFSALFLLEVEALACSVRMFPAPQ